MLRAVQKTGGSSGGLCVGGRVSAVIPQLLFGLAFALANTAGTHRRRSNSRRLSTNPTQKTNSKSKPTTFPQTNQTFPPKNFENVTKIGIFFYGEGDLSEQS
jgi:hypothetical protein